MSVGLVLGAGGLVGAAWLAGGLEALAEETDWDPADADHLVGTSAGSIVASLLLARRPFAVDRVKASGVRDASATNASDERWPPDEIIEMSPFRLHRGLPRPGLGSWSLAFATTARPYRHTPAALYSAWLPSGLLSTQGLAETIGRVAGDDLGAYPSLWIVACDHSSGRRVVFGRDGAPPASLPDAVAASCAIPGTYRSVRIGARHYVDGGMYSTSNLDVLRERGLDLAICLNPTSTQDLPAASGPLERMANVVRRESGRRLGREAKKLRAGGTEVVLVQPERDDLAQMGTNLMSPSVGRRRRVAALARRTVSEQLRRPENRERLCALAGARQAAAAPAPQSSTNRSS
jgi:NTE family protein